MPVRMKRWSLVVAALAASLSACTGSKPPGDAGTQSAAAPQRDYNLEIPMVEYQWDPQAGDPSVSAELGGPGFTGEGWETNMKFLALGDERAVKGGRLTQYAPDWPPTLRQAGKDWNTWLNYIVASLCYESLLGAHPITLDYIPGLATHWKILDDKKTYRFRIDPRARWSDGKEVTADDVVATYNLLMDPTLLEPSNVLTLGQLKEPVAVSKYIVEVEAQEEGWRSFLTFSGMTVFPAHEILIKGSEYLDKYQFRYTASSGAYRVDDKDIVRGKSITVRRRADWWGADNPAWTGVNNIDEFELVVVKDPNLAFEKLKKGELDYFWVNKAQWWAEELPETDAVKRGLLITRKFFTDAPGGTQGMAINMSKPPLDDIRIREALCHLYDRETLIKKLFFNEYTTLASYYPGGTYENPDNKAVEYDEFAAVQLLEEAGWKESNEQGVRVKDGKELKFTLTYRTAAVERFLTVFQEACKRAGIRIELQLLTPAAAWKNLREKEYELSHIAWGQSTFPNPITTWHSSLADQKDNNNVTGFKNKRVDELSEACTKEYDVAKRAAMIREIDGIVFHQHPYVLEWHLPAERMAFANKFGMPEWGALRTHDYKYIPFCWWVDPEKEKQLEAARKDPSIQLPRGDLENRFWAAWNAAQKGKTQTAMRAMDD